jgi:predicted RNA-binding protein YlxR (DUF448 family)
MKRKSYSPCPTRDVPQRTCVVCRKIKAKRELIRLVRVADAGIEIDIAGKKTGRGAYLCRAAECWGEALKGGRLEHALRTTITKDNKERLAKAWEALSGE